jgi:hypothetical protein
MTPNPRETAHMLAACALRRVWETPDERGHRDSPDTSGEFLVKKQHLPFYYHLNNLFVSAYVYINANLLETVMWTTRDSGDATAALEDSE